MTMHSTIQLGTLVDGRYEVRRLVGEGGFGAVFEAFDHRERRRVAVKILKGMPGPSVRRRFAIEAEALARLDHRNYARILDAGLHDGEPYIVTDFVDGMTLREWLAAGRAMPEVLDVACQIAGALGYAHSKNLVHRDLKPANILVVADRGWTAKVVDFGITKLTGADRQTDLTATGEVIGTAGFMSPEQMRASADIGPPTDMYSFGVVLFEMLEGRPPFAGQTPLEICMQHLTDEAPAVQRASVELAQLVASLLEKEPARRPRARAVVSALDAALGRGAAPGRDSNEHHRSAARFRRYVPVLAGVVAIAAVAVGMLLSGKDAEVPPPPPGYQAVSIVAANPPRVETSHVVEVDMASVDAASSSEAVDPGTPRSAGCGMRLGSGRQDLLREVNLTRDGVYGYIPTSYEQNVPHPLIIALHEGKQSPRALLDELALEALADANRFVVVAPAGEVMGFGSWKIDAVARVQKALDIAAAGACIDRSRVFLLGHGVGSGAALKASCPIEVAGIALTSYRLTEDHRCDGPPTPTLYIHDRRDPTLDPVKCPVENGHDFRETEAVWTARNRCKGHDPVRKLERGECVDWHCVAAFTSCSGEGAHWRAGQGGDCDTSPAPFDYRTEIWRFFASLESRAPSATGP